MLRMLSHLSVNMANAINQVDRARVVKLHRFKQLRIHHAVQNTSRCPIYYRLRTIRDIWALARGPPSDVPCYLAGHSA